MSATEGTGVLIQRRLLSQGFAYRKLREGPHAIIALDS